MSNRGRHNSKVPRAQPQPFSDPDRAGRQHPGPLRRDCERTSCEYAQMLDNLKKQFRVAVCLSERICCRRDHAPGACWARADTSDWLCVTGPGLPPSTLFRFEKGTAETRQAQRLPGSALIPLLAAPRPTAPPSRNEYSISSYIPLPVRALDRIDRFRDYTGFVMSRWLTFAR